MNRFEHFCEPVCNFHAAHWHFRNLAQEENEKIGTFYTHADKLSRQCKFSDPEERMVNCIIYGITNKKAKEKLLQTPSTVTLLNVLQLLCYYESLQLHLTLVGTNKEIHSMTRSNHGS